ncbi:MAG: hypothetical protein JWM35_535 [Verrucomicrobia bacterium]|nr:hypothetical protein [Verrucomicrobiota bacterium]
MIPSLRRCLSLVTALFIATTALHAEIPIIAKARAFVGPESALNSVKSIHYVGSLITPDPTDAKKMTYVAVEIFLQAPYRQRLVASSDRSVEVTALDSYDGWHRVADPKDSSRWRMQLVNKDQVKRLRANTWENLAFYRGLEREGGRVIDQGVVSADGVSCRKVAYVHDSNIVFYRYFDESTGRLVLTENESGVAIREQGEIRVNGIRFPKAINTTTKTADGKEQTITLTFDKITMNENFPDNTFTIPPVSGR